ncbi:MFS transporter [Paenibacillus gansuensis]|uniref:MFS transporter n=1 Tax=Paenibacillus gansuensis TaxID=306542 RepID=A0ABW5PJ66_9BACL
MKWTFKFTLLALAVTSTLAPMLAAPAVKLLLNDFPRTNPLLIQLVVTFSSFFFLSSLWAGSYLSRRFSKKSILCLGLILYVIGGVGPAFANSIGTILILRAVLGLGIGLITPLMNALVAEHFEGEERTRMNGLTVGVNGLGGAFFLLIGGTLSSLGWRGVFWTYSFGAILLILVLSFVPHQKPERVSQVSDSAGNHHTSSKQKLPAGVYKLGLFTMLLMVVYYVIPTNLASFLEDHQLGNSTVTGYVTAVSFFLVFLAGVFGPRMTAFLRGSSALLILALLGSGFLLLGLANALWIVIIGVGLVGFGFGLSYPILLSRMAEAAPIEHKALAVMLMTGFANAGQFVSPLVSNGIQTMLGRNSIQSVFLILMSLLFISLLVMAAIGRRRSESLRRTA